MSGDISGIPSASWARLGDSSLLRYAPEPQSAWRSVLGTAASAAGSVFQGVSGGSSLGIEPQYASLIQEQIHQQTQMQLVSLVSNVEKSKHETQMSAIRNVRAG